MHYSNTTAMFNSIEDLMSYWLYAQAAGKWCKKNATDLTYRIDYQYNESYPVVKIMGRLEPEEYTLYLLKYGGTDEKRNS